MSPQFRIYVIIATFSVLHSNINAYYKDCTSSYSCSTNTNPIDCIDNEDCIIDCSGYYGCSDSVINCPMNGNCIIQCSNQYSCKGITINASPNTTLNITCNGLRACRDSTINGNINTVMNIKCANSYACYGSIIDGRYASKLHMIDCATDFWTCYMLTIYCPPNINGRKQCILEGDDSFGGEYNPTKPEPINLYALNSWDDIQFKTVKKDDYYGKMHCMANYSETCDIAQCCDWKCTNMSSICQHPPTLVPTISNNMSTSTQYPSETPTLYITNDPTLISTSSPTVSPPETIIVTDQNATITIYSTIDDYGEQSAENMPETTKYNERAGNDEIGNTETIFFSPYYKYLFYIMIGSCVLCCVICFECWYCYCKRRRKKQFKQIPMEQRNSNETQMVSGEGNGINDTTNGHYKQTASLSSLTTNDICQESDTEKYIMRHASNDIEIIGDDEYTENDIITKKLTFVNAENDEEVVSEQYTTNTKKDTVVETVMSEEDKTKKGTISFIGDAISTPYSL